MDVNWLSNYSVGEADALTDEIEEESQYVGEVLKIREILLNREEESDSMLLKSLRRLQLMELTAGKLGFSENASPDNNGTDASNRAGSVLQAEEDRGGRHLQQARPRAYQDQRLSHRAGAARDPPIPGLAS